MVLRFRPLDFKLTKKEKNLYYPRLNISLNIIMSISLISLNCISSDYFYKQTQDFKEIIQLTENQLQNYKETLVVFDIDNTILKTQHDFGSEHWFLWQKDLIEKQITELPAITDSVNSLLTIQSWIYKEEPLGWVDEMIPKWMSSIIKHGGKIISLTSRGLNNIDSTLREKQKLGIPFEDFKQDPIFYSEYFPYELNNLKHFNLTFEEVIKYNLTNPKPIKFSDGILFTEGQHKGIMLKLFIEKLQNNHNLSTSFKNIIFIDDRIHHVDGMRTVFENRPEKLFTFNFDKSKNWVKQFLRSSKLHTQMDWCLFVKNKLKYYYNDTTQNLELNNLKINTQCEN